MLVTPYPDQLWVWGLLFNKIIMKYLKLVPIVYLIIALISCINEDPYQKQIDDFFKSNLKDPQSFNLVNKFIDSITARNIIDDLTFYDREVALSKSPKLNTKLALIKMYDSVIAVVYKIKYRAKNSYGAYDIGSKSFIFNKRGYLIDNCDDYIDCNKKVYEHYYKNDFSKYLK